MNHAFFLSQLYGEKWNSSAPKFAANLGLNPLEPMKVTSSSSHDGDVKATKSILDVPAAQFDWNSSGLINPLDGKLEMKFNYAEDEKIYNQTGAQFSKPLIQLHQFFLVTNIFLV